jgi:HxlR-like helix-turn-helix protein
MASSGGSRRRACLPRVDYMLSDAGKELIPVMEAMCGWGTKHLGVAPTLPPLRKVQSESPGTSTTEEVGVSESPTSGSGIG